MMKMNGVSKMVIGLSLALAGSAAAANECREFGSPSYSATRTADILGKTITSKVYVSGDREREEMTDGGKTIIRIREPKGMTAFDEISKSGIFIPAPAMTKKSEKDPNTRIEKEKRGDTHAVIIQRKKGEGWIDVVSVVCRPDGVLVERTFPIAAKDKEGRGVVRHTNITIEQQSPDLFKVPADVSITGR
jgi:hypothetical protein